MRINTVSGGVYMSGVWHLRGEDFAVFGARCPGEHPRNRATVLFGVIGDDISGNRVAVLLFDLDDRPVAANLGGVHPRIFAPRLPRHRLHAEQAQKGVGRFDGDALGLLVFAGVRLLDRRARFQLQVFGGGRVFRRIVRFEGVDALQTQLHNAILFGEVFVELGAVLRLEGVPELRVIRLELDRVAVWRIADDVEAAFDEREVHDGCLLVCALY